MTLNCYAISVDVGGTWTDFVLPLPDADRPGCHDLREVFNALRRIVRTGAPWRQGHILPKPRLTAPIAVEIEHVVPRDNTVQRDGM